MLSLRILLTNDDGIHATGLRMLASVAARFGEVVVCAPDGERSACGHSMTLRDALRMKTVPTFGAIPAYEVNGLPVDCVNLAIHELMPEGCDLVISGINNGPNLGWDSTYSGTVGGALEGSVNNIRSIAISIAKYVEEAPPHFETAAEWLNEAWDWLIECPVPDYTVLNVNVPSVAFQDLRGARITRMGKRVYEERVERREDPWGRTYYWQGGTVVAGREEEGTDVDAVQKGFVSITPIRMDWTDHACIPDLERHVAEKARTLRRA